MAAQPTVAELLAQIQALQGQVNALTAAAAAPTAPVAPTTIVFADTPQSLDVENVIDYGTKRGSEIFKQGCAALDDKSLTEGFNMTADQVVIFVEALQRRCKEMGWDKGSKNITSFLNRDGVAVDIIKNYGQVDEASLRTACARFCSAAGVDSQSRARQNNTMMSICLGKSLSAEAQTRLLTYRKDFIIEGVECAPLMYKVIMRLATIDSVATTKALRNNLQNLGTYASTVSGDIDKINTEFDKNYSQIIARGATVDDPVGILFEAYKVVPCHNFKTYIHRMQDDYLDGKLPTMSHESLMGLAKNKFNYLKNEGTWGAKSFEDDKIIAMAAAIENLKGQLKLNPKLAKAAEGKDKKEKKGKGKNKKNNADKVKQKKDEAWKKVPPKDGEKKTKEHDGRTYHWCVHHMAWTMHDPKECRLGLERKGDDKGAKPSVVAASATTSINPSYQALLSTLARMQEEEE